MSTLWQDLRFAGRTLRKRWMITGLAVLSLALAIGGNAAVFSMVDAFLFRPLPYPEPERLVLVGERQKDQPEFSSALGTSLPTYGDLAERGRWIELWGAMQQTTLSVRGTDRAEPVSGVRVAGDFFAALHVAPYRGRLFSAQEMTEGGPRVALLGHDYWVESFGADTDPLGAVLTLDGEPHEVIGILPEGFEFFTANQDLWLPLQRSPHAGVRDQRSLLTIGRLAEGATMEQVRADATAIMAELEAEHPGTQRGWTADVFNMRHDLPTRNTRILFALLQGCVLLVLAIACVNVINLLLARGQERSREIALRTVLGAGRARIVRQLLTESSLMALAGAAGGVLLGVLGVRWMSAQFVGLLPANFALRLDARVLGFTLAISLLAGLVFGLVPALQTFRKGQAETLKESGGSGGRRRVLSRVLVIGEIALSFVALGGGSLLVQSFLELQGADPGFEPSPLLTASVQVPASRYPDDGARARLNERVLELAASVPGVTSVTLAGSLPQAPIATSDSFRVPSVPLDAGAPVSRAVVVRASPGYLATLGIGLRQGRFFEEGDRLDSEPVAVVDRALAEEQFGDRSALDQEIVVRGEARRIVGVVDDIQQVLIQTGSGVPGQTIYLAMGQESSGPAFLILRTTGDPGSAAEPLRSALQGVDPDLSLAQVLTMQEYVAQFFVGVSIFNTVLSGFGLLALLLASIGTYGVLAYSVNRRGREIGIRMALGAQGRQVVRMFARQGLWLGVIGLGVGALLTLPLVSVLRSALQGLSTVRPSTLGLIAAILLGVTMVATFVPAGRAAGVDPMRTLRDE